MTVSSRLPSGEAASCRVTMHSPWRRSQHGRHKKAAPAGASAHLGEDVEPRADLVLLDDVLFVFERLRSAAGRATASQPPAARHAAARAQRTFSSTVPPSIASSSSVKRAAAGAQGRRTREQPARPPAPTRPRPRHGARARTQQRHDLELLADGGVGPHLRDVERLGLGPVGRLCRTRARARQRHAHARSRRPKSAVTTPARRRARARRRHGGAPCGNESDCGAVMVACARRGGLAARRPAGRRSATSGPTAATTRASARRTARPRPRDVRRVGRGPQRGAAMRTCSLLVAHGCAALLLLRWLPALPD
jgi:hypothetical protein